MPARVYLLNELQHVCSSSTGEHALELTFIVWGMKEELILGFQGHTACTRWMRGLRGRIARFENAPPPEIVRRVWIERGPDAPSTHLGVTCENWPVSAIGALVTHVEPGDLVSNAGVCAEDVLIAVNGEAVLSHRHAIRRIDAAGDGAPLEFLVRQPTNHSARPPS